MLKHNYLVCVSKTVILMVVANYSIPSMCIPQYSLLSYRINQTWDSQIPPDSAVIQISFQAIQDASQNSTSLRINVNAPYYGDPKAPNASIRDPCLGLWHHEVVEAFFMGNDDEYLEIELAPSGHYILLFLRGKHNLVTYDLPLKRFTTNFSKAMGRWHGEAFIPGNYFPCNVTRFNAYAIHKSGQERVYMSLFPVPKGQLSGPDFHKFDTFQPIQLGTELNPKCS